LGPAALGAATFDIKFGRPAAKCQILVYEKLVMSALDKASEAAEARKIADALTLEAAEAQKKADALTLPAAEVAEAREVTDALTLPAATARMPQRRSNRLGNRTRR
jgi:uncharacterized protein with von Willebrand factor type A (vWA) domain